MNNEQKVFACIKEGMTDRQAIADKCGMKRNQVMSTYRHLQAKGLIERTTEQQQLGRGKGSLPSVYRVVGEKPIYRSPYAFASSIFSMGGTSMRDSGTSKVLECIKQGITDRSEMARLAGLTPDQLHKAICNLKNRKAIYLHKKAMASGRGNGSKPGVYLAYGAEPVYRGTFSHVSSIFHVGASL